ncbi:hypothetical protein HG530_005780 [Fusarium avenaceum]|nr:hypothetical protein HG530_005780 [Fusarium avenaceum]
MAWTSAQMDAFSGFRNNWHTDASKGGEPEVINNLINAVALRQKLFHKLETARSYNGRYQTNTSRTSNLGLRYKSLCGLGNSLDTLLSATTSVPRLSGIVVVDTPDTDVEKTAVQLCDAELTIRVLLCSQIKVEQISEELCVKRDGDIADDVDLVETLLEVEGLLLDELGTLALDELMDGVVEIGNLAHRLGEVSAMLVVLRLITREHEPAVVLLSRVEIVQGLKPGNDVLFGVAEDLFDSALLKDVGNLRIGVDIVERLVALESEELAELIKGSALPLTALDDAEDFDDLEGLGNHAGAKSTSRAIKGTHAGILGGVLLKGEKSLAKFSPADVLQIFSLAPGEELEEEFVDPPLVSLGDTRVKAVEQVELNADLVADAARNTFAVELLVNGNSWIESPVTSGVVGVCDGTEVVVQGDVDVQTTCDETGYVEEIVVLLGNGLGLVHVCSIGRCRKREASVLVDLEQDVGDVVVEATV